MFIVMVAFEWLALLNKVLMMKSLDATCYIHTTNTISLYCMYEARFVEVDVHKFSIALFMTLQMDILNILESLDILERGMQHTYPNIIVFGRKIVLDYTLRLHPTSIKIAS